MKFCAWVSQLSLECITGLYLEARTKVQHFKASMVPPNAGLFDCCIKMLVFPAFY